ncbi:MAG: VCBS repeat-containing protein, partial [Deltaproteobacteria bacterium]
MTRSIASRVAVASLAAALSLGSASVRADWPMAHHDRQRTGATTGTSTLTRPVPAWSYYLGGAAGASQVYSADVNNDHIVEILMVSSGKLVAKRADDTVVWESPPMNLQRLVTVADLNGDGEQDIVAVGTPGLVAVFGGRDGRLEWHTRADTFGPSIGAVRVGDFNRDGRDDLYVADSSCGAVGQVGDIAWAFTFGDGFGSGTEDGATRLWQLERGRDYVCGVNDVVADLTGDHVPDVVTFSSTQMWLFDGLTGRKISSGNDAAPVYGAFPLGFSVPYGVLTTEVADLDLDGRPEIVGYTNNSYTPSINSRSVLVIRYDATRTPDTRLYVAWRNGVATLTTDTHTYLANGAADLDRDGQLEVVSTFSVSGTPTTYVYRGSDGTVLVSMPGTVNGIWDTGVGQPLLLGVVNGSNFDGYRFASLAAASDAGVAPVPAFSLPDVRAVNFPDRVLARSGSANFLEGSVPDTDGVHRDVLFTARGHVQVWNVAGTAAPARLADLDFAGLTLVSAQPETDIVQTGPGLLLARSDGYLLVTDPRLNVLNFGTAEVPLPGVRTGGYYSGGCGSLSSPAAARYNHAGDSLFAVDSRGVLLRLDATAATRVRAPVLEWQWANASRPLLYDANGDGMRDVLAIELSRQITARAADGTTRLFTLSPASDPNETAAGDIVPLEGTTGRRFSVPFFNRGTGETRVYGVDGTGTSVFATTPVLTAGSGAGYVTALDINADGREDVLIDLTSNLHFFSGLDGSDLGTGGSGYPVMPVVTRGEAGSVDLLSGGSLSALSGYALTGSGTAYSLSSSWSVPGRFASCEAAVVRCADGLRFASAIASSPHIVVGSVATGSVHFDVALAGGRMFPDDAALGASTVTPGVLGNATATPSLTGGDSQAFLVGSTDGFLYAIDACATTVPTAPLWAVNFHASVGEPIFADSDGDG